MIYHKIKFQKKTQPIKLPFILPIENHLKSKLNALHYAVYKKKNIYFTHRFMKKRISKQTQKKEAR